MDEPHWVGFIDFGAQMTYLHVDNVGDAIEGLVPDVFDDHVAQEHAVPRSASGTRAARTLSPSARFVWSPLNLLTSQLESIFKHPNSSRRGNASQTGRIQTGILPPNARWAAKQE